MKWVFLSMFSNPTAELYESLSQPSSFSVMSVSYTHLDVYKRQLLVSPSVTGFPPIYRFTTKCVERFVT